MTELTKSIHTYWFTHTLSKTVLYHQCLTKESVVFPRLPGKRTMGLNLVHKHFHIASDWDTAAKPPTRKSSSKHKIQLHRFHPLINHLKSCYTYITRNILSYSCHEVLLIVYQKLLFSFQNFTKVVEIWGDEVQLLRFFFDWVNLEWMNVNLKDRHR